MTWRLSNEIPDTTIPPGKTSQGISVLQSGQVITLPTDKANMLIDSGKIRPVRAIIDATYKEFMKYLKSYSVTDNEIKEAMPVHWQKLQAAIKAMDDAYYKENLHDFNEHREKVLNLYLNAVTVIEGMNGL